MHQYLTQLPSRYIYNHYLTHIAS